MINPIDRHDPVETHYAFLERFELKVDAISWLAIAAFALYVIFHLQHMPWDGHAKLLFVLLTVLAVTLSYWFRFAIQPVADRQRRRLLITDGTGALLTADQQNAYWNNAEKPSLRRLLFDLAENTFFVPRMLRAELGRQIALVLVFAIALLVSLRFGTAEIVELFAVLLVFSEVLLGKLVRMVWTLIRMRHLHLEIVSVLRARDQDANMELGRTLFLLGEYEYIKSRAGYRASDRTFQELNPVLTQQWDSYRNMTIK